MSHKHVRIFLRTSLMSLRYLLALNCFLHCWQCFFFFVVVLRPWISLNKWVYVVLNIFDSWMFSCKVEQFSFCKLWLAFYGRIVGNWIQMKCYNRHKNAFWSSYEQYSVVWHGPKILTRLATFRVIPAYFNLVPILFNLLVLHDC